MVVLSIVPRIVSVIINFLFYYICVLLFLYPPQQATYYLVATTTCGGGELKCLFFPINYFQRQLLRSSLFVCCPFLNDRHANEDLYWMYFFSDPYN